MKPTKLSWSKKGQTALRLVEERGFHVFPLPPKSKEPYAGTHGHEDATADPKKIREWWERQPDSNIGIATGAKSDLLVLDVDPKDGGDDSLRALEEIHGALPETYTVATGGHGLHFYFKYVPGVRCSTSKVGKGLDIRCEGGYVVAPSSTHDKTGLEYQLKSQPIAAVEPPPGWLVSLALGRLPKERSEAEGPTIAKGSRNSTLASRAGSMRRAGLSGAAIEAALQVENRTRCFPPLAEAEVRTIAKSISRYSAEAGPPAAEIISATDLMARTFVPRPAIIETLATVGLNGWNGAPKLGKSWAALQAAMAIAEGSHAFGRFPTNQGAVLVLALEDTLQRIQTRVAKILNGRPVPSDLYFQNRSDRLDRGGLEFLRHWLTTATNPKAIIIDTLVKVRAPARTDRSIYESDYQAVAPLKELADEFGIAVIFIHHTRKSPADDFIDEISGSTGLTGAADTLVVFQRGRGQADAMVKITGRDVEETELAFQFDGKAGTWKVLGDAAAYSVGQERGEILRLVHDAFPNALSAKDIAAALGKSGNAVRQLLFKMDKDGELKKVGHGRYTTRRLDE